MAAATSSQMASAPSGGALRAAWESFSNGRLGSKAFAGEKRPTLRNASVADFPALAGAGLSASGAPLLDASSGPGSLLASVGASAPAPGGFGAREGAGPVGATALAGAQITQKCEAACKASEGCVVPAAVTFGSSTDDTTPAADPGPPPPTCFGRTVVYTDYDNSAAVAADKGEGFGINMPRGLRSSKTTSGTSSAIGSS